MKIRIEHINDITGIALILCGILTAWQHSWEMTLSWLIFGCMYLVMDKYNPFTEHYRKKLIFAYIGCFMSLVLISYYFFSIF